MNSNDLPEDMKAGYIRLWRKYQDHGLWQEKRIFSKFEAWIDILTEVRYKEIIQEVPIGNKVITVNRGQSIKSLDTWAKRWGWNKSKVRRVLNLLQDMNMIELENVTKTTRITVCNYDKYNPLRNASETQVKRKRNASETHSTPEEEGKKDIKKEGKKIKSSKPRPFDSEIVEIIQHLNQSTGRNLNPQAAHTKHISARLKEGATIEQCKAVIDSKVIEWMGGKMESFLRPQTLFNSEKFDIYRANVEKQTKPKYDPKERW